MSKPIDAEVASAELVNELYDRAARQEARSPSSKTADNPGLAVDATLRLIKKLERLGKLTHAQLQDYKRLAQLLDRVWSRNMRRDLTRAATICRLPMISEIPDPNCAFESFHARDLISRIYSTLVSKRFRPDACMAFLLDAQGCWSSSEIAVMCTSAFGRRIRPCLVRQWRRRRQFFAAMRSCLQRKSELFFDSNLNLQTSSIFKTDAAVNGIATSHESRNKRGQL